MEQLILEIAAWVRGFYVRLLLLPSSAFPHNVMHLPAEIVKQTFTIWQEKHARQVGTWGDKEGILFCGFRLHKHHYHLPDLGRLCCSEPTPILSGTLNCDAGGLSSKWAIESTKRTFFFSQSGVCGLCEGGFASMCVR